MAEAQPVGGGCGAAACGGAGAGSGGGEGAEEEPVTEPNQRVRRLPLLRCRRLLPVATEVLHAPGDASAVRVGGAAGSLTPGSASPAAALDAALVFGAHFGGEGGDGGRVWVAAPPPSAMSSSTAPPPALRAAASSASPSAQARRPGRQAHD